MVIKCYAGYFLEHSILHITHFVRVKCSNVRRYMYTYPYRLILSRFGPEISRFPVLTRLAPNLYRFAPNLSRFDPNMSRFAPNPPSFAPNRLIFLTKVSFFS